MIGYLLCDPHDVLCGFKRPEEWPLRTMRFERILVRNECAVILFSGSASNNYVYDSERYLAAASGTIIFEENRGQAAAQRIAEHLQKGRDLEEIYKSCYGPFNLLIVDKTLPEVTVLTDREGLQGAFVYDGGNRRMMSSNPLLLAAIAGARLNSVGAWEYVHLGHSMQWRTIFDGIERLRGGMKISKGEKGWKTKELWRLCVSFPYRPDEDKKIVEVVHSMIENALVNLKNTVTKRIGIDLTGGTDSRTVLSFCLQNKVLVEATTAGPHDHEDVLIARRVADQMAIPFYWYEDRPVDLVKGDQVQRAVEWANGILSPFAVLKLNQYYREKASRYDIMTGGCGGPLFKDHYWLYEFNRIDRHREPNWDRIARLSTTDNPVNDELTPGFKRGIHEHLATIFREHSHCVNGTNNQKIDFVYFDLKCPNVTGPQFGLTNQFLDVYHPLLDGRIVQYVINARPFIRKWNNLEFSLILRNDTKLAWIPTDNRCPAVPSRGRYFYLRGYVAERYLRAAARKIRMYALRREATKPVHPLGNLSRLMEGAGFKCLLDYPSMSLAEILDRGQYEKILSGKAGAGYGTYQINIASVEMAMSCARQMRREIVI